MPLPPDVAGELGRYVTLLKKALVCVQEELGRVRSQIRMENLEAQLLGQLTGPERTALGPCLQKLDLAELQAERVLLSDRRDALVKAIGLLEARLG